MSSSVGNCSRPSNNRSPAARSPRAAASEISSRWYCWRLCVGHVVAELDVGLGGVVDAALLEREADVHARDPHVMRARPAPPLRALGRDPAHHRQVTGRVRGVELPRQRSPPCRACRSRCRELTSCISARSAAASAECDGTQVEAVVDRPGQQHGVAATGGPPRRASCEHGDRLQPRPLDRRTARPARRGRGPR